MPVGDGPWAHGSKFASHLPLFRERNVGVYQWGLVAGAHPDLAALVHPLQPGAGGRAAPVAARRDPPRRHAVRPGRCRRAARPRRRRLGPAAGADDPEADGPPGRAGADHPPAPGGHDLAAQPGETLGDSIYETANRFGPHKLIAVTVNRAEFAAFGTHPGN